MSSLLDLDQIIIDEQAKRERAKVLYDQLFRMKQSTIRLDEQNRPFQKASPLFMASIKRCEDDIRALGYDPDDTRSLIR